MMIKRRFDSFFQLILNKDNTTVPTLKNGIVRPVPMAGGEKESK